MASVNAEEKMYEYLNKKKSKEVNYNILLWLIQILKLILEAGIGQPHRKKNVREFLVPNRDVTTKLSLGGNNDVVTELFLPRGSLEFG